MSGPLLSSTCTPTLFAWLESELQAQLYGAAAARPDDGVGRSDVRSGARTTKSRPADGRYRRIVVAIAILPTVGIGKVRMIKNVKELHASLSAKVLAPFEVLGQRKIHNLEAGI